MKLTVRTIKNENFTVEIPDTATIKELRSVIATEKNVDPRLIRIIFSGKALDDSKLASFYNLKDSSIITIVINTKVIETPQPVVSQPVVQQSVVQQPVVPQQVVSQPVVSQPVVSQPVTSLFDTPEPASFDLGNLLGNQQGTGNLSEMMGGNSNVLPLLLMGAIMNDPELLRMYQENPNAVLQMITDPNFLQEIVNGIENIEMPSAELTEADENEIKELTELGIPETDAKQFYLMANKDKMIAANMFFNQ